MTSSRLGLHNLLDTAPKTEHVVVCKNTSPQYGWTIAEAGGFVKQLAAEYYVCKTIVANNLQLNIISDYPGKMY